MKHVMFVPCSCKMVRPSSAVLYGKLWDKEKYHPAVHDKINVWTNLQKHTELFAPLFELAYSSTICILPCEKGDHTTTIVESVTGQIIPDIDIEIDDMLHRIPYNNNKRTNLNDIFENSSKLFQVKRFEYTV